VASDLTLPARSPYVPEDEPPGDAAALGAPAEASTDGEVSRRPTAEPTVEAPAAGATGGFARVETADVVSIDDSSPVGDFQGSSSGFSALESAEVPTSIRPVPTEDDPGAAASAPSAQEPSSETLLDDALVIEATSALRPSADTTGELDAADVLEAVELIETEMPKPPPSPKAAAKGATKAKPTPPPPPPPGGTRGKKPTPPPVPRRRG
jgi:hypothetical protein